MNNDEKFISILNSELVVALGCTEPIAIALCASKAKEVLGDIPDFIDVYCSNNIIKNVHGVTIPNSNGLKGVNIAAALGAFGGDSSKNLEVLDQLEEEQINRARDFVRDNNVTVHLDNNADKLFIRCILTSGHNKAEVEIEGYHTNITLIKKNDKILMNNKNRGEFHCEDDIREDQLSIDNIYEFAFSLKFENYSDLVLLLDRQINYNMKIASTGLNESWGNQIGKILLNNGGNDLSKNAAAWAAAGSDARMGGSALPVVLNSGSGNQGLTVSVPVIYTAKQIACSQEKLYRALIIANLVSIHQKKHIGYLSAFCGAVNAATGAGAGIAFLFDMSLDQIKMVITNTLVACLGILCDGAKPSCALKIYSSLMSAFFSIEMAKMNNVIPSGDGIVGDTIEQTIDNIGQIAVQGMNLADEEILKVILNHKK